MNLAPRDNDPPRGSFVSIEPGRWGSFVYSNTDSKCRNMVDGCHLSLVKGRRGHLTLDCRRKNQEERGGSVVFRNTRAETG